MLLGTPDVGDVVGGRYRIIRLVGGGGMSTVFEAENTFTNKRVAVKWLLASLAGRPDAKDRMLREARAGSRIKHRHVVDIYDVGFEGESMFLVMEMLEGETLARALEGRTMSIPAFVNLLLPVLRGVMEAHRLGVIHRDIKPDNIMLAREVDHAEPVPMVLDFGIAKMDGDALRTRSGNAQGTPAFMAYEQIRGMRDLDARVDVYAFGVILYMGLAGRMPITAETWPELIYKLTATEVPPLITLRPELPAELSELVARAMARDREQRTASLELLVRELTPFASAAESLGDTRRVVHDGTLASPSPQFTTQPASAAWEPPNDATPVLPAGSVRDALAPLEPPREEARQTSTVDVPARGQRLRVLLPVALAVALLLAWVGTRSSEPAVRPVQAPSQVSEGRAAPSSAQPVTTPPAEQAVSAVVAAPQQDDAGAVPRLEVRAARPTAAQPRVPATTRHEPAPARPPAPSENKSARRRLSQDEFFGGAN